MDNALESLSGYSPLLVNSVKALVFLVVGYMVAGLISRLISRRVTESETIDNTLGVFLASLVRYLILIFVLIAVLQLFGFQATSLIAVLGAASLAIGLALQGTLTDIASGFMLIIFRPYKLEQYVDIGGTSGTVKDINIFCTQLLTPNNIQIILPNSKAWGSIITNYSHNDTRRLDLSFGIDYANNADVAMEIIRKIADADSRVKKEPEAWVRLVNLGESSVDLGVRLWCDSSDFWELKWSMLKAVKEKFDENNISIPYPHSVVIKRD
ncbi:MAG: small conductance mechanosensitive channel [Parasphingorhabdus sp.]|jgi:small conductance mechanosensitive channel